MQKMQKSARKSFDKPPKSAGTILSLRSKGGEVKRLKYSQVRPPLSLGTAVKLNFQQSWKIYFGGLGVKTPWVCVFFSA